MSDHSAIEWTDATWNPTTGCTKISPGCAHCYIERTPAFRIAGNRFVHGKTDLTIFHDRLDQPLHWRKPRRVFVNSLSDLFHDDIGDAFIDRVFAVMALARQHTFQVLTKRPERMHAYLSQTRGAGNVLVRVLAAARAMEKPREYVHGDAFGWPYRNVWLGVSVENQHFADARIPLLLQTPAAVRFISAEPLLASIDISKFLTAGDSANPTGALNTHGQTGSEANSADTLGPASRKAVAKNVGAIRQEAERPAVGIDWVIVGGESGPRSRPFDLAWARSIVAQCQAAGVPVFVKQLGSNPAPLRVEAGSVLERLWLRDRKGGNVDEWPEDLRVREYPR